MPTTTNANPDIDSQTGIESLTKLHTVFKQTPTHQQIHSSSINDKRAVQAKHIRKVGLPALLHIAS